MFYIENHAQKGFYIVHTDPQGDEIAVSNLQGQRTGSKSGGGGGGGGGGGSDLRLCTVITVRLWA